MRLSGDAASRMAARFGLDCTIYMGEVDVERQRPNVFWMERLGAEVVPVTDGTRTLKDAINEAFRDWVTHMDDTHYALGTACGPHPFPEMVTWFQSVIGEEARRQIVEEHGALPSRVYACVGGGSNAMGVFSGFLDDEAVELVGVEAGGRGLETGEHAARLASADATIGVAQGYKTFFLQDGDGQMRETHSVAAGLDYVGVSPILSDLSETGRVRFEAATDAEVVEALSLTVRKEGLIPALESSHAFVQAFKEAPTLSRDAAIVINQSGRGGQGHLHGCRRLRRSQVEALHPGQGRCLCSTGGRAMSLADEIRRRREQRDILLMTHIVVGYPSFDESLRIVEAMVEAGVDVMELQVPFSEPTADGPVILRANQRSLDAGSTVERCLEFSEQVAQRFDIPFLLMTYYNILYRYGVGDFAARLRAAGLRGAIVPDLPPEEAGEYLEAMRSHTLAPVFIFTPTTSDARMRSIAEVADGLIYCVARRGVTGAATDFGDELDGYLARCRAASGLPLALGFGVKDRADVDFLRGRADLAVIGTQTIRLVEEHGVEAVKPFIESLRDAR